MAASLKLACAILAFFVVAYAQKECEISTDFAIVFEVPPGKIQGLSKFVYFVKNLWSLFDKKCDRFAVVLASAIDGVEVIKRLEHEYNIGVNRAIQKTLRKARTEKPDTVGFKETKKAFASAIGTVKENIFKESSAKARKYILLISSTKPVKGIKLTNFVGKLHENAPPGTGIQPFVVLGLAVKDGQDEDISELTRASNRVVTSMESFSRMAYKTGDSFSRIKKLLEDPESKPQQFKFGGIEGIGETDTSEETLLVAEAVNDSEICKYIADIAFLIDSSGSLKKHFHKEKQYIQRIASRYQIKEDGTHAGAVVFSDSGNYTKMTIKFSDHMTTEAFNSDIAQTPLYNYRTRIDLAFKVAEEQLFQPAAGMRPNMQKNIFLVTDGKQNPTVDDYDKNIVLDPVKASEKLFNHLGVSIFAVGVGKEINETELRRITRSPNGERVMLAKDLDELISDEFVRASAKKSCLSTLPASTIGRLVDSTPQPPIKDCNKCCCGGGSVYVNIFQAGAGGNYVMQGATVTQTGNSGSVLTGTVFPRSGSQVDIRNASKENIDRLIKAVTDSLGNNKNLGQALRKLIGDCAKPTPTRAAATTKWTRGGGEPDSSRKRRSIDDEIPTRLPRFIEILKVAKLSGCNKFIKALEVYGIINELDKQVRHNKTVTIFCPVDSALEGAKLYPSELIEKTRVRNLLRHHVAMKHDDSGTMYRTTAKDGHIFLHPSRANGQKQSWKVEEAHVKFSLYDGKYAEIVMVDKMLTPPFMNLKRAIKHHPNLTMFYSLLNKFNSGDLARLMQPGQINKVCFKAKLCVGLSQEMQSRITQAVKFQQLTLVAPSNTLFKQMKKSKFEELGNNKDKLREFFRKRLYLGIISKEAFTQAHSQQLVQPLDWNVPISVVHQHEGGMVIATSDDVAHRLVESIRVKEGIVLVEDDM